MDVAERGDVRPSTSRKVARVRDAGQGGADTSFGLQGGIGTGGGSPAGPFGPLRMWAGLSAVLYDDIGSTALEDDIGSTAICDDIGSMRRHRQYSGGHSS